MLYKPVYLASTPKATMKEPLVKVRKAPPPKQPTPAPPARPPTPPPPPSRPLPPDAASAAPREADEPRLPLLICVPGAKATVVPQEATRDVLAGKVDYYLVDDSGMTLFKAQHVFSALKLDKPHRERLGEYPCVGAHQRFFPRRVEWTTAYPHKHAALLVRSDRK